MWPILAKKTEGGKGTLPLYRLFASFRAFWLEVLEPLTQVALEGQRGFVGSCI